MGGSFWGNQQAAHAIYQKKKKKKKKTGCSCCMGDFIVFLDLPVKKSW